MRSKERCFRHKFPNNYGGHTCFVKSAFLVSRVLLLTSYATPHACSQALPSSVQSDTRPQPPARVGFAVVDVTVFVFCLFRKKSLYIHNDRVVHLHRSEVVHFPHQLLFDRLAVLSCPSHHPFTSLWCRPILVRQLGDINCKSVMHSCCFGRRETSTTVGSALAHLLLAYCFNRYRA